MNLYFKDENNKYHKFNYEYHSDPENPRIWENLGTMVFLKQRNYKLGDEKINNYTDFFINQLTNGEGDEYQIKGKIIVDIPTLEQAKENNKLKELYIRKDLSNFEKFDTELFYQNLEKEIDKIYTKYEEQDKIHKLDIDLPLTKDKKLSDQIEISYSTSYNSVYSDINDEYFKQIEKELLDVIKNKFNVNFTEENSEIKYKYQNLTEEKLYDLWSERQFFILPINIYEHSDIKIYPANLDFTKYENINNNGFIFVSKENQEVLDYLEAHSEEETKDWLYQVFESEIKLYNQYIRGEVYSATDAIFNEDLLSWEENESNIILYEDPIDYIKRSFFDIKFLSKYDMQEIENTITDNYIDYIGNKYLEEVKKTLPEYDGNIAHAQTAIYNSWNEEPNNKLKIKALKEYLSKNEIKNNFDPFHSKESKNYETIIKICTNPNSQCYNSTVSPEYALIIDKENKRYGLLQGPYRFNTTNLSNITSTKSIKKIKDKIQDLESDGYHFEKFTGNESIINAKSQGDVSSLFKKNNIQLNIETENQKFKKTTISMLMQNPETRNAALTLSIKDLTKDLPQEEKITLLENLLKEIKDDVNNKLQQNTNNNSNENTDETNKSKGKKK